MQKLGLIVVASGVLIVIGLVLLALGNQVILEDVSQRDGRININQDITISTNFDSEKTEIGIFAVQVMNAEEKMISAKILDPSDIEIISQKVDEETIENEFDILESGIYKLIIQSNNEEEIHVFGAIGPLPDEGKKSLSIIAIYLIIIGMIGLFGAVILKIKKKSI